MASLTVKYRIAFVSLLTFFYFHGEAQKDSLKPALPPAFADRPFVIKADVLAPFMHTADWNLTDWYGQGTSLTAECLVWERSSFQLTLFNLTNKWNTYENKINDYSIGYDRSFSIIPEYKFYVSRKKRHSGYFFGAYLRYTHTREETNFYYGSGAFYYSNGMYHPYPTDAQHFWERTNSVGYGIMNGLQFYLFKRITFEALAGVNMVNFYWSNSVAGREKGSEPLPLDMRLALNVGYRFGLKPRPVIPDIPWD